MKNLVIAILSVFTLTTSAQNPFYDAIKLTAEFQNNTPNTQVIFPILAEYSGKDSVSAADLINIYKDSSNHFFTKKVAPYISVNDPINVIQTIRTSIDPNFISQLKDGYPADLKIQTLLDSISINVIKVNSIVFGINKLTADSAAITLISNRDHIFSIDDNPFISKYEIDTSSINKPGFCSAALTKIKKETILLRNNYNIEIGRKNVNINGLQKAISKSPASKQPSLIKIAPNSAQSNSSSSEVKIQLESEKLNSYKIPSQSDAIDALAIFIAGRFKEEVSLTFFNTLRSKLDKDSLMGTLFPQTAQLLNFTDVFDQPTLGGTWQHAFASDLIEMPDNLANSKDPRFKGEDFNNFRTLYSIVNQLRERKNYVDIIDLLFEQKRAEAGTDSVFYSTDIGKLLGLMKMVNETFTDSIGSRFWLPYTRLKNMTDQEFSIFYGLISRKYAALFNALGFKDYNFNKNKNQLRLSFLNILLSLNELERAFESNLGGSEVGKYSLWNAHYDVFNSFLCFGRALIPGSVNGVNVFSIDLIFNSASSQKFKFIFSNLTETSQAIDNQEYNVVLNNMVELIKLLYHGPVVNYATVQIKCRLTKIETKLDRMSFYFDGDTNRAKFDKYRDSIFTLLRKMERESKIQKCDSYELTRLLTAAGVNNRWAIKHKLKRFNKFINRMRTKTNSSISDKYLDTTRYNYLKPLIGYMSFISDALRTKDSKSLSKVVASYAAPPNSYKIKRNNLFSAEICSYPGIYIGNEWKLSNGSHLGQVVGFTTPIGVSFSFGIRRNIKYPSQIGLNTIVTRRGRYRNLTGSSLTFAITGLDLGAVVSYRISNSSDQPLPKEISIAQVFSPGVFISYGFKNTPMCMMLGGQINPKLRTFVDVPNPSDTYKFSITLCYDIPLYNIWYTKKRYSGR